MSSKKATSPLRTIARLKNALADLTRTHEELRKNFKKMLEWQESITLVLKSDSLVPKLVMGDKSLFAEIFGQSDIETRLKALIEQNRDRYRDQLEKSTRIRQLEEKVVQQEARIQELQNREASLDRCGEAQQKTVNAQADEISKLRARVAYLETTSSQFVNDVSLGIYKDSVLRGHDLFDKHGGAAGVKKGDLPARIADFIEESTNKAKYLETQRDTWRKQYEDAVSSIQQANATLDALFGCGKLYGSLAARIQDVFGDPVKKTSSLENERNHYRQQAERNLGIIRQAHLALDQLYGYGVGEVADRIRQYYRPDSGLKLSCLETFQERIFAALTEHRPGWDLEVGKACKTDLAVGAIANAAKVIRALTPQRPRPAAEDPRAGPRGLARRQAPACQLERAPHHEPVPRRALSR